MISRGEVQETNNMISEANLDVRTITKVKRKNLR